MSRKLLRALSTAVAGSALVAGTLAGAGAGTAAGAEAPSATSHARSQLPTLIGDADFSSYVTFAEFSTWQDPYVRMLPPSGSGDNAWDLTPSTAGGTAVVHLNSGGCLQPDLNSAEQWVAVGTCLRDANESWDVRFVGDGTVFVHLETEGCLTRPTGDDGGGFDQRLWLAPCDDSAAQLFHLVV